MMRLMLTASALAMALAGQAAAQKAPDPYKVNPFLGKPAASAAAGAVPLSATTVDTATTDEAIAESRAELAKPRTEPGYSPPRLSDGHPDLQGVWSNASNTTLTRPAKYASLVMDGEEAARARREHPQNIRQATDDNQKEEDGLLNGRDLAAGRGYNAFWIDPGTSYSLTKGTWRTSWIVDPPSGQIPYSAGGREWLALHRPERGNGFDNPEERSLAERCIFFGRSAGPPLTNGLYNNNYRIAQSADAVAIEAEMIHETRIIRLNAQHDPAEINRYAGDSIGWWEGDTLVVETINMNAAGGGSAPLTPSGRIIERFTRYNDQQVLYEFEVHDAALYSRVWKGEIGLNATSDLYEYACHEGNYGLTGILSGGRANDRNGVSNFQGGRREE